MAEGGMDEIVRGHNDDTSAQQNVDEARRGDAQNSSERLETAKYFSQCTEVKAK
jgi:hypothetical protein